MRVLFVDDEKQVLRGIERMLDGAGLDWDVEFADSALEALDLLSVNDNFDTLVTDMKMPGMDGATLLQEVSEKFPHLVRIVLSGQAGKDAILRAVNPMHQYLAKPCDAATLTAAINGASAHRDAGMSQELHSLVGSISKLPSSPASYQAVMEKISDKASSIESIGQIISQDPAMTAKLLQIANSAIFGLSEPVVSAKQATIALGIETMKSLVLSVGIFREFEVEESDHVSIEGMRQHALNVANSAANIGLAEKLDQPQVDLAFTGAILHDIGKLVLLNHDLDGFRETVKTAKKSGVSPRRAEQELFGVDHAAVGAHLLSMWGIPRSIVEIVASHHNPVHFEASGYSPLTVVNAANQFHLETTLNVNSLFPVSVHLDEGK